MFRYLMVISLLLCSAIACRKAAPRLVYMNTATITGPNLSMTACGAAYRIIIHGSSEVGAQFNILPSVSGIDLATVTFPLEVKINWHHNIGSSCDTLVNIITIDNVALIP